MREHIYINSIHFTALNGPALGISVVTVVAVVAAVVTVVVAAYFLRSGRSGR